jgi:hypothetical protein
MAFTIAAITTPESEAARTSPADSYGNRLEPEIQTAPGNPCRHCLRRAKTGERLILTSYSPYDRQNPYKEVGPIFVHADGCERYDRCAEFPEDFLGRPIVLRGYDADQRIAKVAVVVDGSTIAQTNALLADPAIAFVQARSFTHGCYLFRIDRT